MSLMDRIRANECAVNDCHEDRAQDAQVCAEHLRDLFANRLDRKADGSYEPRRMFVARDETWRRAA